MNSTKHQAVCATAKLDRHPDIPAQHWPLVHALLAEIAKHYPDPYPGQKRLGEAIGRCDRQVRRYLAMAVAVGLVEVLPNTEQGRRRHGHWTSNRYSLKYLHGRTWMSSRREDMGVLQTPSPKGEGGQKSATHSSSEERELGGKPPEGNQRAGRSTVMAWERKRDPGDPSGWDEPAYGQDPDPPPETKVVRIDPAVSLARYFERQWISEVLPAQPDYRGIRIIDTGPAVGYLRAKMLTHLSRDHVEAYIDLFMEAAVNDLIDLKPGQSPWQHFTGWWGWIPVEDPAVEAERRREGTEAVEAYRRAVADKSARSS